MKTIYLLFVFFAFTANASNYYISNAGSDGAAGTSSGTSWQTISKVNGSSFSPGDSILFKSGDTWAEALTISSSGSSGNPIIFGSYGTGSQPIITGSNSRANNIIMNNQPYVTIYNIELRSAAGSDYSYGAIQVGKTTITGITIRKCTIDSNRHSGIYIEGLTLTGLTIDSCNIINNGNFGVLFNTSTSFTTAALTNSTISNNGWATVTDAQQISNIQGNLGNVIISHNIISNATPGQTADGTCHGIYISTASVSVADIHDNIISSNGNGAGIKLRWSANVYNNIISSNGVSGGIDLGGNGITAAVYNIHNNSIYGNASAGVAFSEGAGAGSINCIVQNNTFYHDGVSAVELSVGYDLTGLTVKNNIFYASNGRRGMDLNPQTGTYTVDYNLYWQDTESGAPNNKYNGTFPSFAGWQGLGFDTHGLNVNPLLTNPSTNLHLQSGSPAKDVGVDVGIPFKGASPDIGAFEYGYKILTKYNGKVYINPSGKIITIVQ